MASSSDKNRPSRPFALEIPDGLDPGPDPQRRGETRENFVDWPRLPVLYTRADAPPAFRFMFADHDGAVVPYGCLTSWGLVKWLHAGWPGAAGDVLTVDDTHAIARFAWDHLRTRDHAERHLRPWAALDGWELEIQPGTTPMLDTDPWRATIAAEEPSCPACGVLWSREEEGKRFRDQRYVNTLCRSCGAGRVAPCGLLRCETCGEARGWLIEGELGELAWLSSACICEGITCRRCGKARIRRPVSNYFQEGTGRVWHVPHFIAMGGCELCRDAPSPDGARP